MAQGSQYNSTVSVSSSGNAGAVAFGINATYVLVINDSTGTATAYMDFTSTSAGVSISTGHPLKNGEYVSLSAKQGYYTGLSVVTSSGTATFNVRVLAVR